MLAPLVWSCCTAAAAAAAAAATAFSPPAYVALHVPDVAPLDARLRALSHPSSPEYGHWLTSAEVARLAHPPLEQQHAVLAWLGRFANVSLLQNCGDVIKVWADASTLQAMWGGTWTTDGCLAGYVIPAPLRTLVAFVELCSKPRRAQQARHALRRTRPGAPRVDDRFLGREPLLRLYGFPSAGHATTTPST